MVKNGKKLQKTGTKMRKNGTKIVKNAQKWAHIGKNEGVLSRKSIADSGQHLPDEGGAARSRRVRVALAHRKYVGYIISGNEQERRSFLVWGRVGRGGRVWKR